MDHCDAMKPPEQHSTPQANYSYTHAHGHPCQAVKKKKKKKRDKCGGSTR